jgi:hypothetical protein
MELEQKVNLYFGRAKGTKGIPTYEPGLIGKYKIFHGQIIPGRKENRKSTIVEGSYRMAIEKAVQMPEFFSEWMDTSDPSHHSHGYIERIE